MSNFLDFMFRLPKVKMNLANYRRTIKSKETTFKVVSFTFSNNLLNAKLGFFFF